MFLFCEGFKRSGFLSVAVSVSFLRRRSHRNPSNLPCKPPWGNDLSDLCMEREISRVQKYNFFLGKFDDRSITQESL